jgi:hypothetical protein
MAFLAAALSLLSAGCNYSTSVGPDAGASPTPEVEGSRIASQIETSASVSLTRTTTPGSNPSPAQTGQPGTSTSSSPTLSATPCSDRAAFVEDVTIRDNTLVLPGQTFVKVWRLQNTGSCTWDTGYAAAFIGGERMEAASPVHLTTMVPPGSSVDLSVDLVAPQQPGSYQGFWKLVGKDGGYFGIGADADLAFWAKIVVPALPTETGVVSPSLTPTASATPKPTPVAVAAGLVALRPDDSLDLDSGEIDRPSGSDAVMLEPTPGAPALVPAAGAGMSRYGPPPDPPSPSRCQALNLTHDPIPLSSLSTQSIICYRTTADRFGYFRVKSLVEGLVIEFVTWGP